MPITAFSTPPVERTPAAARKAVRDYLELFDRESIAEADLLGAKSAIDNAGREDERRMALALRTGKDPETVPLARADAQQDIERAQALLSAVRPLRKAAQQTASAALQEAQPEQVEHLRQEAEQAAAVVLHHARQLLEAHHRLGRVLSELAWWDQLDPSATYSYGTAPLRADLISPQAQLAITVGKGTSRSYTEHELEQARQREQEQADERRQGSTLKAPAA